jgi:hypothetical protein
MARTGPLGACLLFAALSAAAQVQTIEGDVVDAATGKGIAGARVRMQSQPDDPVFATADENGHFRFPSLPFRPRYDATARAPGFMSARFDSPGDDPPEVVVAMRGPVRIPLQRFGVITGNVTDASGIPVGGALVFALQRFPIADRRRLVQYTDSSYQYAMMADGITGETGEYRIAPLAPGPYYLVVRLGFSYSGPLGISVPRNPRDRTTLFPHALEISDAKAIEVAADRESRINLETIRQSGVTVTGQVLGGKGTPQELVSVVAWSPTNGIPMNAAIDANGRFSVGDLLPGKYVVAAVAGRPPDSVAAARREIEVGTANIDRVDLALAPTHDLKGTVAFDGCAQEPVWIQWQGDSRVNPYRDLRVDIDGRFTLSHVVPGNYKIYVRPERISQSSAVSARLGDAEVLKDGFAWTSDSVEALRITMRCQGR